MSRDFADDPVWTSDVAIRPSVDAGYPILNERLRHIQESRGTHQMDLPGQVQIHGRLFQIRLKRAVREFLPKPLPDSNAPDQEDM